MGSQEHTGFVFLGWVGWKTSHTLAVFEGFSAMFSVLTPLRPSFSPPEAVGNKH